MRKELVFVYVMMGLLVVALEALRYVDANFVVYEHFPLFPLLLLLGAGTGFWATKVAALRYGVLGGALIVLTASLLGMSQDDQVGTLLINGAVFGSILGLLGGLPVWLRRSVTWRWPWIALVLLPVYAFPTLMIVGLYTGTSKVAYSMKRVTLTGRVMDVFEVFDLERPSGSGSSDRYGRVLVAGDQVYAFIENPINARLLRAVRLGDSVQVEAEMIPAGHLLQILSLTRIDSVHVALDSIQSRAPVPISIRGKNLCQCGIRLGSLQSNCSLGHLHHLSDRGRLYNYLLTESGQVLFNGGRYHFRQVRVTGELYGDFFLKVSDVAKQL